MDNLITPTPPQVAQYGGGDRTMNAIRSRLHLIAQLGAWPELGPVAFFHMNPQKVEQTRADWNKAEQLAKRLLGRDLRNGTGYRPVLQALSGPGHELGHSLDMATFFQDDWQADISQGAARFAHFTSAVGGVQTVWHLGSSGGHVVPGEVFTAEFQTSSGRPETTVLELPEPSVDDKAAHWIYLQRLHYLLQTDFQGYDLTFLARNDLGLNNFSSLGVMDEVCNVALTLWLAARGPNQKNLPEMLAALKVKSPVAGIWGVRVPVEGRSTPRVQVFGHGLGTKRQPPSKDILRSQAIRALRRVETDPTTTLTGLPALPDQESVFYGLVLPIGDPELADKIRSSWQGNGVLTIVANPFASALYAIKIAPVDWTPLIQEVGMSLDQIKRTEWRRRRFNSFEASMRALESRRRMTPGTMGSVWRDHYADGQAVEDDEKHQAQIVEEQGEKHEEDQNSDAHSGNNHQRTSRKRDGGSGGAS